jgi:hypothetical protein
LALGVRYWGIGLVIHVGMKGTLIILLLTGQTLLEPFAFEPREFDGVKGFSNDEILVACWERAEELYFELAEHSWEDPRGQGWYLKDGRGTIQGHIC